MSIVRVLRNGSKPYTHRAHGEELLFLPNEAGHLVCRVNSPAIVDILLGYEGGGFVLYSTDDDEVSPVATSVPASEAAVSTEVSTVDTEAEKYVIGEGDNSLDLKGLDDKQLHAFCKANSIEVNARAKGDTIRDRIVESLTEPAEA